MGSYSRKQTPNIVRLSRSEIIPLEIWDCITPLGILWDSMYLKNFTDILNRVIINIHRGRAKTRSNIGIDSCSQGFDAVFVAGGGSDNSLIQMGLRRLPFPVIFSSDPVFSGSNGGKVILKRQYFNNIIIDVGQSQIKISMNDENKIYKRNFSELPISIDSDSKVLANKITIFENYLITSINDFLELRPSPNTVVFALPCSISLNGTLGSCSFSGIENNNTVIENIVKKSTLNCAQVLLLNDAELSSYEALDDSRLQKFNKILVITIGFGVGATIINRSKNTK